MGWKFWQKNEEILEKQPKAPKASKPRDLPSAVGRTLVLEMKQNPDWVWKLQCVMWPLGEGEDAFNLRVFDPNQAYYQSVEVKSFKSLDDHPDLVLYTGVYRKRQNLFQILRDAA